jgi:uncharacterized protein (TIGR00369 family)
MTVPAGFEPLTSSPFAAHIGGIHRRAGDGPPVVGLLVGDEHANSMGTAHGGVLSTLVDLALGLVVKQTVGAAVTVDLHARFLAPASVGDWIEGRGQVDAASRSVVQASCVLAVGERVVVRATGVYSPR